MLRRYSILISMAGALALLPAVSMASRTKPDPQKEAARLFERIEVDAVGAQVHADRLQTDATNQMIDWQVHAMNLSSIRHDVNDIDKAMTQLQSIRGTIPSGEQQKTDKVVMLAEDLSINTNDAIQFLSQNRGTLWQPVYHTYAANIYKEARQLSKEAKKPAE